MGESSSTIHRAHMISNDVITAASVIYKGKEDHVISWDLMWSLDMYGDDDGTIPATFQILYMIGWKPDQSQVRAAYYFKYKHSA